jgi:threonine synthase
LILLGLVDPKPVKFFGAQASGCSPISTAVKQYSTEIEPQRPKTIARSLAIGNPADGHYALKAITKSGGWSEDVSDAEVVSGIQLLAESEGIFTETAGGVTVGTARKLIQQDRILPDETTVLCITGNGSRRSIDFGRWSDVVGRCFSARRILRLRQVNFACPRQTTTDQRLPSTFELLAMEDSP